MTYISHIGRIVGEQVSQSGSSPESKGRGQYSHLLTSRFEFNHQKAFFKKNFNIVILEHKSKISIMDPQSLLIGVAAFVISAILIYLISAFTMKEKTFEEVLEEQRRRQEEEREKQKSEKKAEKEHKKKYRKGKEKTKEKPDKPAPVQETDVQRDHKMVNLEIDPEIIEPVETVALNTKKSKNKKSKSILVNKEEKPLVTDGKQTKELYHKDMAPKDEVELHHEQQRGKDKQHPEQQSKASKKQEKAREAERLEKERIIHVEKRTETMVEIQHTRAVMAESEVKSARAKGGVLAAGNIMNLNQAFITSPRT